MVILDSGAIVALYDGDDEYHSAVTSCLEHAPGPLVLPAAVLAEVDDLIRRFVGYQAEIDFLSTLENGTFALEAPSPQDISRCLSLIQQYRDLDLGLADAAVIATAERLGVRDIVMVDQRDFRAVRSTLGTLRLLPLDS